MKAKNLCIMAALLSAALTGCNNRSDQQQATGTADNGKAVVENILTRTSVRSYTSQTVSSDTIETLLRAGMAAPTAVNKQPWHFVVVTDKGRLTELAKANPNAKMLEQAPLAIVVCGDMRKTLEGPGRAFWLQDCSAATENILLAAHAVGLGAVWTALYPAEGRVQAASEVLKLPEYIVPLCTVVIGYPAEQPEPKDKWDTANVSYNEFGSSSAQ